MSPFNIGLNSAPAARVAARDTVMLRGGIPRPNPPTSGGGTGGSGGGGGGRCFTGGTLIVTDVGAAAMQTVKVGQLIRSGAGISRRVSAVHCHEFSGAILPCYRAQLRDRGEWNRSSQP